MKTTTKQTHLYSNTDLRKLLIPIIIEQLLSVTFRVQAEEFTYTVEDYHFVIDRVTDSLAGGFH